ncbi:MAG: xanthine dehydrogenase family protein molybdopterin-binding subunit, partial [Gammaproteobacteria bacterium]
LTSNMVADGGGIINFSPSVGTVAVTALQSIYYFPRSDLQVKSLASTAVPAGSMRGYGTLQSMSSMEMMVDELAQELDIDAIALRQKNLFRTGMKNTQGAIPAGALRTAEILERAGGHPIWTERDARKKQFEAANPDKKFGTGFACVQKDFGTGAEAAVAQVEVTCEGRIKLRHVAPEIGTGASTAQSLIVRDVLGQTADDTQFAVIKWPEMPLTTTNEPYTMSQDEHDKRAKDPAWTPRFTSPSSASNSSYYFSHATREAARLVFRHGLWEAAQHVWRRGIGSGQMGPLAIRIEDARWVKGKLTAGNLEPLPFKQLATIAHDLGLLVGATVHTFNRWAWAEADFTLQGKDVRLPLDALAVKLGKATDYQFIPRTAVHYPPTQRNNAAVTYYAPNSMLLELSVHTKTGEITLLNHHSIMECGKQIVPELVSGQLQGGIAMGIGHALHEHLPMGEDGPGNGQWNFDRYQLPRGKDVAVWNQTADILEPLSDTDRPKGIGEVVMIPVVAAIANAVHAAIGERFYAFPITPQNIKEALK